MKKYLGLDLDGPRADLSGLFPAEFLKIHLHKVQGSAMAEIERNLEEDEDLQKEDLIEAQETAGFHEIELRHAIGSLFNHLFLWSILENPAAIKVSEPQGKLKEYIDKYFTSTAGLKEAFTKAVNGRVLPGWVWLGLTKEGQLVVTQTNNEDNTLMHGIAMVQCTPVLGIDLWEHAYFTPIFEGDKEAYVERFWAHLNWGRLSQTFESHNLKGKVAPIHPSEA